MKIPILILLLVFVHVIWGFTLSTRLQTPSNRRRKQVLNASPSSWLDVSSALVSVQADYAAEIENAVGEEIYGPIFKAGLFIFVSGLVSAGVVAFIVSNRDSWIDLDDELERGKEAQLIQKTSDENFIAMPSPDVLSATLGPVDICDPGDIGDDDALDALDL